VYSLIGSMHIQFEVNPSESYDPEFVSKIENSLKEAKKLNLCELCNKLIKCIKTIDVSEINDVIIENQPSLKNPFMKTIQVMILSYFVNNDKNVILQNPISKTFGHKFTDKKNKYRDTKLFGITLVKNLINESDFKKIVTNKKTDDICDAILHAVYFLSKGKCPDKIKHFI
jgi:hypothetical protein